MIQQRFEVDRSLMAVYDALARPQFILESLPGVIAVSHVSEDIYRIAAVGEAGATRETELQLTAKTAPRHVEWRTADSAWSGSIDLESVGAERTAVSVTADHVGGAAGEATSAPASVAHEVLQGVKRALQPGHVNVGASDYSTSSFGAGGARRFASEWRETAQSALTRPTEFPFKLIRTLTHQMDRMWGDVLRGTPMQRLPQLVPGFPRNPNVEVSEHENEVRVCIDVPGVDESQLQVEIHEGTLTIRGERHDEQGAQGRRRSELHYGAFVRRIPLPDGVDADAARAQLRHGVLEIHIPVQRREPRRVPVQPGS